MKCKLCSSKMDETADIAKLTGNIQRINYYCNNRNCDNWGIQRSEIVDIKITDWKPLQLDKKKETYNKTKFKKFGKRLSKASKKLDKAIKYVNEKIKHLEGDRSD